LVKKISEISPRITPAMIRKTRIRFG